MKTITFGIIISALIGFMVWGFGRSMPNTSVPTQKAAEQKLMRNITLTSIAFQQSGMMPERFTCDGANIIPPLAIADAPLGTKTLALVMHDPDAPRAGGWTHWVQYNVLWNMKSGIWSIEEGQEPEGTRGKGTGGESTYQGPCPPSGTHRYVFTVYALDAKLSLKEDATKTELESAMEGRILGKGELIGLYSRKR